MPTSTAKCNHIHTGIIDIFIIQQNLSLHPAVGNQIIHPVQTAQQGAFTAAGRADEGRHLILTETSIEMSVSA